MASQASRSSALAIIGALISYEVATALSARPRCAQVAGARRCRHARRAQGHRRPLRSARPTPWVCTRRAAGSWLCVGRPLRRRGWLVGQSPWSRVRRGPETCYSGAASPARLRVRRGRPTSVGHQRWALGQVAHVVRVKSCGRRRIATSISILWMGRCRTSPPSSGGGTLRPSPWGVGMLHRFRVPSEIRVRRWRAEAEGASPRCGPGQPQPPPSRPSAVGRRRPRKAVEEEAAWAVSWRSDPALAARLAASPPVQGR